MVNTELLEEAITNSGKRINFLAKKLGITTVGFANKRSGKTDFRLNEVRILVKELNLTRAQAEKIFDIL